MHLNKVMRHLYPDEPTHTYVDGSHVKRYGPKGHNVRYGEGGGTIQLQDQFMIATSMSLGMPVSVELYPGNQNDPTQYSDFIPQLMFLLKRGSMLVMDNGGSSSEVLDDIVGSFNAYLTRVRINSSDEKAISEGKDRMLYIGLGAACIMRTFASSQRTTYLYFSVDSYAAGLCRAEKAVQTLEDERLKALKVIKEGNAEKLIRKPKNPFYEVEISGAKIVVTGDPWVEIDPDKKLKEFIPTKNGWFKLECSFPMDPRLALIVYRHRVDVEYVISILKSTINMAPLRVWDECSTRGKLVLGMIVEFILFAAINDMEAEMKTKVIDGKPVSVPVKPSARTLVKELKRYEGVVKAYPWGSFHVEHVRDDDVLDALVKVIDRYDSEGPFELPEGRLELTLPTAQWDDGRKNCKDLAMSIAQFFAETKFPEFMVGRRHWKDVDPASLVLYSEPLGVDRGSFGTNGLRGKTSFYDMADRTT